MNEPTNNQAPKKSFWAKLFGGKDNTQTQPTTQPIPVPPTNQTVAQAPTGLPDTPPVSELPPSSDTANPQGVVDANASSQDFASTPVVPNTDQVQSAVPSEFVAQPPSDPMVTPVSTLGQPEVSSPGVDIQPTIETQPDSSVSSDWAAPSPLVQDTVPTANPLSPDNLGDSSSQFDEVPSSSSTTDDSQTPPSSPVV
jgi:hypothetical protein